MTDVPDHRCQRCGLPYVNVYLRRCLCDDVRDAEGAASLAESERAYAEEAHKEAEKTLEIAENKLCELECLCSELADASDVGELWALRTSAQGIIEREKTTC